MPLSKSQHWIWDCKLKSINCATTLGLPRIYQPEVNQQTLHKREQNFRPLLPTGLKPANPRSLQTEPLSTHLLRNKQNSFTNLPTHPSQLHIIVRISSAQTTNTPPTNIADSKHSIQDPASTASTSATVSLLRTPTLHPKPKISLHHAKCHTSDRHYPQWSSNPIKMRPEYVPTHKKWDATTQITGAHSIEAPICTPCSILQLRSSTMTALEVSIQELG